MPSRNRINMSGKLEVLGCQLISDVVGGDPEPDSLPPDVDVRVMVDLTSFGSDVHRQVYALVPDSETKSDKPGTATGERLQGRSSKPSGAHFSVGVFVPRPS